MKNNVFVNRNVVGKVKYLDKSLINRNFITNPKEQYKQFERALELKVSEFFIIEEKLNKKMREHIRFLRKIISSHDFKEQIQLRIFSYQESSFLALRNVFKKYYHDVIHNFNISVRASLKDLTNLEKSLISIIEIEEMEKINEDNIILVVSDLLPSTALYSSNNIKGFISLKNNRNFNASLICNQKNISYLYSPYKLKEDELIKVIDGEIKKTNNIEELSNNRLSYKNNVIGYFKTELIYVGLQKFLGLQEQISYYNKVLESNYPNKVCFRLFDFSKTVEPIFYKTPFIEPFELFGTFTKLYTEQIEALVKSAKNNDNLMVIIPRIQDIDEYYHVRDYIKTLTKQNNINNHIEIGLSIQTINLPLQILNYKEADFIVIEIDYFIEEVKDEIKSDNIDDYLDYIVEKVSDIFNFLVKYNTKCYIFGEISEKLKEELAFIEEAFIPLILPLKT